MRYRRPRISAQLATSESARLARVEAALGDGREICPRCHATLWTYADACSAELTDPCPGFRAIEVAGQEQAA